MQIKTLTIKEMAIIYKDMPQLIFNNPTLLLGILPFFFVSFASGITMAFLFFAPQFVVAVLTYCAHQGKPVKDIPKAFIVFAPAALKLLIVSVVLFGSIILTGELFSAVTEIFTDKIQNEIAPDSSGQSTTISISTYIMIMFAGTVTTIILTLPQAIFTVFKTLTPIRLNTCVSFATSSVNLSKILMYIPFSALILLSMFTDIGLLSSVGFYLASLYSTLIAIKMLNITPKKRQQQKKTVLAPASSNS